MIRVDEIGENWLKRKHVRHHADLLIQPNVGHVPGTISSSAALLIELGRKAGEKVPGTLDWLIEP
ncbi:MAG: hypothetical protein R3C12_03095 [Planctomycetaceae bacterium]